MIRPSGRRGAGRGSVAVRPLLLRVAGFLVLAAGWGGLVWLAIDAGRAARAGDRLSWLWLALASLGAVVLLVAALVVAARALRGDDRPAGKHR